MHRTILKKQKFTRERKKEQIHISNAAIFTVAKTLQQKPKETSWNRLHKPHKIKPI